MLKPEEIKKLIDADSASVKKQRAKVGQAYYEGDHDIKNYRIFFVNADGNLQEDTFKSNIRICHPFFTENTDQLVEYLLSGDDGFVRSDDPDLQDWLDAYFNENEDFMSELADILTDAIAKGFSYAYAYKKSDDGLTHFKCADSIGVVEVEARFAEDKQDHILYWYTDRADVEGKTVTRIQDWDSTQSFYYVIDKDGNIVNDPDCKVSPRPHSIYKQGDETFAENYGQIPFERLDYNKKQQSGLYPIKDLIDDYDLMAAGLSNNIQDANEVVYFVRGFQGDNLDELQFNLRNKKVMGVPGDDNAGVDVVTIEIPVEARRTKLELDEKSIYRFGFGLNTAGLKDTAATTNLAIQTAYSLLDLRASKLKRRVKSFMRRLLKIVLAEINEENGTDYQQKDVYFVFEPEIPTNAQENANIELIDAQRKQTEITTLLNVAAQFDNETIMQLICEQLDIDYNDIKDKLPTEEDADPYKAVQTTLDSVTVEEEGGAGDLIE